jgi:hypothetical protein
MGRDLLLAFGQNFVCGFIRRRTGESGPVQLFSNVVEAMEPAAGVLQIPPRVQLING